MTPPRVPLHAFYRPLSPTQIVDRNSGEGSGPGRQARDPTESPNIHTTSVNRGNGVPRAKLQPRGIQQRRPSPSLHPPSRRTTLVHATSVCYALSAWLPRSPALPALLFSSLLHSVCVAVPPVRGTRTHRDPVNTADVSPGIPKRRGKTTTATCSNISS